MAAGFGAAVVLALYYVLGARGVERRDTLSLTTWAFGASAVAGLLARAVTAGTGGWEPLAAQRAGVPVWLLCCYVVVLGSIVPYLLVAGALRHLPATSVGIIGMVEPVLAAAIAWVTLGAGEALNAGPAGRRRPGAGRRGARRDRPGAGTTGPRPRDPLWIRSPAERRAG